MIERGLYWSSVANIVFNAFLCYSTIMLNSVTIHAIRKTSSLPKPLKILLLSLAVSDLGVGLLVQPLSIARLVIQLEQNARNNPTFQTAYHIVTNFFIFASFFSVVSLSMDRFMAIHLHLRYQELVTQKRVVSAVISFWAFCVFLVSLRILVNIKFVIVAIIDAVCFLTAAIANWKIHATVRHRAHQLQALQAQQVAQNVEIANVVRLKKSAYAAIGVFIAFLVCYLPHIYLFRMGNYHHR